MRLQEAIERDGLSDYKDFLETLLEDLQYYGTLSDRTLRKIFLPDLATASGVEKMRKVLDQLIAEMGRDYLARYRDGAAEDEIIIGIEQRLAAVTASKPVPDTTGSAAPGSKPKSGKANAAGA